MAGGKEGRSAGQRGRRSGRFPWRRGRCQSYRVCYADAAGKQQSSVEQRRSSWSWSCSFYFGHQRTGATKADGRVSGGEGSQGHRETQIHTHTHRRTLSVLHKPQPRPMNILTAAAARKLDSGPCVSHSVLNTATPGLTFRTKQMRLLPGRTEK